MNKKELNEIQRFQEMIQTSVDLIEGEFADVAIDTEVVTSPYFDSHLPKLFRKLFTLLVKKEYKSTSALK
jgi:hypothetical protein